MATLRRFKVRTNYKNNEGDIKMKRISLVLIALVLAKPALAAITPYGSGSISDTINPASYGCVIDNGNWVFNAGVVEPAIAGCDPGGDYNGVPIGEPTKLMPQLVGNAANQPTATHRWWGSVAFLGEMQIGGGGAYLTPDPMMVRVSNLGIRILGIPNGLRVPSENDFLYQIPDAVSEVFDGIAIGNSQFSNLDAFMKDYSDGSVTVEWRSGATPVMEATMVYGSPYMFFEVFAGEPVIRTRGAVGGEKGLFHQQNNSLGVWTDVATNRNHYLIVGEGATSFSTPESTESVISNSSNRFTVAWLPVSGTESPTAEMISTFEALALNRIARLNIDYSVDQSTQAVTVQHSYVDSSGAAVDTLAGLMPLQWKNTGHALGQYKTRSARGIIRFTPSSGFDYQLPYVGVLPTLPTQVADLDEAQLRALVTEFVAQGSDTWSTVIDTYWSGKNYSKVAELSAIARSVGMDTEADQLLNWLKLELEDWFTASGENGLDNTKYFVYDDDWSTLLGFDESFGAHQQLNDHHFHYGYFVRAAAEICRVDKSWCGDTAYGPMVDLLIRDYAGGRDDPMFPYMRNFDPANGFSWASGHANFALGNNNESTSEAANAYGAIILYGLITGQQDLVDRGVYLHASSAAAYWEYWNNLDAYNGLTGDFDNFPEAYTKMTTSIIWGAGGVYSTWFSGADAHILGIQGLPLNPLVLHIGQHKDYLEDYVTLGLVESSNGQPSGLAPDQWTDIWWNILAMTDPARAINDFNSVNLNYTPEQGETKAHTYQWIHVFNAIGSVATGNGNITANYPSAAAFDKNGVITYIAYNLGDTLERVEFSDGMAMNVPSNSFGIKHTGDTPDPVDGGDTQAPTQAGSPTATNVTTNSATLNWSSASDNVGVVGYDVTVNGNTLNTSITTVNVAGLSQNTQYVVTVVAYDAAGNRSTASAASFTTETDSCAPNCNADTQAPSQPASIAPDSITATGANLTWNASTDNVGVTGYEVTV
ncbi:MAG: endo-1,3(4)-beta-glucanase, partial [Flavobacteriales bacterium]